MAGYSPGEFRDIFGSEHVITVGAPLLFAFLASCAFFVMVVGIVARATILFRWFLEGRFASKGDTHHSKTKER